MKSLFLALTFLSIIMTVHAQRSRSQFICQLSHKDAQTAFYLFLPERRSIEIYGWKINTALKRVGNQIEISLQRVINIMDATYQRKERKMYPMDARTLTVQLEHSFSGNSDVFYMVCHPRDP